MQLASLSLTWVIVTFAACAIAIGLAGWRLSRFADMLADRTGLGEAISGALFLGATTSFPGTIASVTAAASGFTDLAISNAIGGIAAQTAFLGIADLAYRKANLEHAAASTGNLLSAGLLVVMLSVPLVTYLLPPVTWLGVHPVTLLLPLTYLAGMRMLKTARAHPMWTPRKTAETREDVPDSGAMHTSLPRLWAGFAGLVLIVGVAGYFIAKAGAEIAARTGLSENAVGGVLTAVSTSLPELITSVAAVRHGALTLAVSGIIGGNAFDVIFLSAADVAYRQGSIYHQMNDQHLFLICISLLMTGVLQTGMVYRQERGPARIGFESCLVLALYGVTLAYLFAS